MAQSTITRPPSLPNSATHRRKNSSTPAAIATLARWQLRQTWKLLMVVGVGMLVAVVLVSMISLYLQVTMSAGVQHTLNTPPTNSYLRVHSFSELFSPSTLQRVQPGITQQAQVELGPYIQPAPVLSLQVPDLHLTTNTNFRALGLPMQDMPAHVKVVAGRLPATLSDSIEVALTPETARELNLSLHLKYRQSCTADHAAPAVERGRPAA